RQRPHERRRGRRGDRARAGRRRSRVHQAVRARQRRRQDQARPGAVSPLYLYAVLGVVPAAPLGEGLADEPVRTIDCGPVVAAVSVLAEAPVVTPDTLRRHDAVVRRLSQSVDAILPARFGALVPDDRTLRERLGRAAPGLHEALARVAGREQMILRVFAET